MMADLENKITGETEEEENESDDESDSETTEDGDEEPKLKYERIRNMLEEIINKDAASCMAVHTKFFAVGTHWGVVHVLDHEGNTVEGKEFSKLSTTVNQISLDGNADYVASCSDDGRVAITGLYENEHNFVYTFDCPIKSVALDEKYSKPGSGRQFITGGDKLVLHEKGLFGRSKSTILHQGEGPIRCIKWKGDLVAWANDIGVKVYDMTSKRRISFVKRNHDERYRPEIYRCNLCWKDQSTLLIGWAKTIHICKVRQRPAVKDARDTSVNLPSRYLEILMLFNTDFIICGLAPLNDNLVILAYIVDESSPNLKASRPQLKIVSPLSDDYETISSDALSTRGYDVYRPSDYHLEYIEDEKVFYIVSPKDIIVARQRDMDDHIGWLIENEKFETALKEAQDNAGKLQRWKVKDVGRHYLNHLISEGEFQQAASLCNVILGRDKASWEHEVYQFAKMNQLKAISPFVPRGDLRLSKTIYEMILNEFLQTDLEGFQKLIREWPHDLYELPNLVCAVQDRINRGGPGKSLLQCALGDLYAYDNRFDLALEIYLKLKHKDVFPLINKHNLFDSVQDKIVMLMEFDQERAVKMLVANIHKVPVKKVVKQLEGHPKLMYHYLHAVFMKDSQQAEEYHNRLVNLYAEFSRERLLHFLKTSNSYTLQNALDVCQERGYTQEMVFLLARMGNIRQALHLITEELQDVDQAIEFCKEQDDNELWDDLIKSSINKPSFITGLLNNIGTHVDPIILIEKIKEKMEIPGLRDSLVKILQDYNLQISLREGCKKILVSDCFSLLDRLNKIQRRGVKVEENQFCDHCNEPLFNTEQGISVFYCHHVFHSACVLGMEQCMICHSQRKGPSSVAAAFRR